VGTLNTADVVFTGTTQGHYDVAFNGNTAASEITANITKLARDGIILEQHYVHWHCSPTRRSFLSGRLPIHHHEQLSGTTTDDLDLRYTWCVPHCRIAARARGVMGPNRRTAAVVCRISGKLKEAGYKNYWVGKGPTGSVRRGLPLVSSSEMTPARNCLTAATAARGCEGADVAPRATGTSR
jgi:arylsulfatase A-like enzyme